MSDKIRRYLRLGLLLVFIISTLLLLRQWLDNSSAQSTYDDALDIATHSDLSSSDTAATEAGQIPPVILSQNDSKTCWAAVAVPQDDEHLKKLQKIDIAALQEVNPDVLAWIYIPGTKINYPVLQGEDNEFYLDHAWRGQKNLVGSIFMECRNTPGFQDFNTILYGHNMNDGSMFSDVIDFTNQRFATAHPHVYLVLPGGVILRYDVFSSYQAALDGQTYGLSFHQEQTRVDFLNYAKENSLIQMDVEPKTTDLILTLSTCTGRGYSSRWVLHARLEMIPYEPET